MSIIKERVGVENIYVIHISEDEFVRRFGFAAKYLKMHEQDWNERIYIKEDEIQSILECIEETNVNRKDIEFYRVNNQYIAVFGQVTRAE